MTQNLSLASKTLAYWTLSSSYNNRIDLSIPFEEASRITGNLMDTLDPHRPLAFRVRILDAELVNQTAEENAEPATVHKLHG